MSTVFANAVDYLAIIKLDSFWGVRSIREMKEETNLEVRIVSLILDELSHPNDIYRSFKTYLCEPNTSEASPGFEPEPEAASWYSIVEVKWFDLHKETGWDPELIADPYTYAQLQRVRNKLGYLP